MSFSLSAANKSCIDIVGALFVRLEGLSCEGKKISCATMVYISPTADGFFLSLEGMLDMGLINRNSDLCPQEMQTTHGTNRPLSIEGVSITKETPSGGCEVESEVQKSCSCPTRSEVPCRPTSLPFPKEEACPFMGEWGFTLKVIEKIN